MSDFLITDHGSVIAIVPLTPAAVQWINNNVASEPWQWLGGVLCVDPHYARRRDHRGRFEPLIRSPPKLKQSDAFTQISRSGGSRHQKTSQTPPIQPRSAACPAGFCVLDGGILPKIK